MPPPYYVRLEGNNRLTTEEAIALLSACRVLTEMDDDDAPYTDPQTQTRLAALARAGTKLLHALDAALALRR
jgi:hypothetical protein